MNSITKSDKEFISKAIKLLMKEKKVDEKEAHRLLRIEAMNNRRKLIDMANVYVYSRIHFSRNTET